MTEFYSLGEPSL